jgi:DNA-binding LytR/AlgR family response regulator
MEQAMKFLVVDKADDSVHILDLDDVVALSKKGKTLEYHTKDHIFEHITSLESLTAILRQHGFERLDRDNIVNMNKISRFDSLTNKVFFGDEFSKPVKSFTVSWANVRKLRKWLQEMKGGNEKD